MGASTGDSENATVRFGDYLVDRRLVAASHLNSALDIQNAVNHKLGILATMDEILTVSQVYTILEEQRRSGRPFGQVARMLDLINQEHLLRLLDKQSELRMRVGEILVGLGYLTVQQMETALEDYCAECYECS
jgi:hypothetical protein